MGESDVYPRRNLGLAEYWGRTVENRITTAAKQLGYSDLTQSGVNRSNASSATEIAKNLQRLEDQIERTQALLDATPGTGSVAGYVDNFSLTPGWQTVLVTAIPAIPGRLNLDLFANAVVRIVDTGSGGGSGGGAFSWPFPVSTVTSEYGPRDGRMHQGIDFGISQGTPIPASNAGTVVGNGFGSGTGYYVDLAHDGGIVTRYFHMVVQSDVGPPGTVVSKGQTIGLVGNTGNSFGAHLHWETIVNGTHWNPRDFMAVYGDGSSVTPAPGATEYADPRARIFLNGMVSVEFSPHRDLAGTRENPLTLNQLFPIHQLDSFPSQTGQADIELQLFSKTNVAADPGNFVRVTAESISRP